MHHLDSKKWKNLSSRPHPIFRTSHWQFYGSAQLCWCWHMVGRKLPISAPTLSNSAIRSVWDRLYLFSSLFLQSFSARSCWHLVFWPDFHWSPWWLRCLSLPLLPMQTILLVQKKSPYCFSWFSYSYSLCSWFRGWWCHWYHCQKSRWWWFYRLYGHSW